MTEHQTSYRQIMKATSLFGGVQVFNILISIIRSKFIAVLLGPAGMGIMGLLISTTGLIGSITNFGLGTSAVKDIAAANNSENRQRISLVVVVFRRLVWITGILGTSIMLVFSSLLSQLTFGNRNYTVAFLWISITLLLAQLSSGQLVLLQGMRKLKQLAKANVLGSGIGLIATIPFYYIYGTDGIVPGIIVTAVVTLIFSWFFSRNVTVEPTIVNSSKIMSEGKNMLHMGFLICLSGLLSVGASYLVRIFISRTGNVEQVGLYNAGFAIINTYVGLVFSAMSTDYYPRLSAVAYDNKLCKQTINQQIEIAILILAPILIIFVIFIKWVILLLYSNKFIDINSMIYWAALGIFFKAVSWSIAFIFLAKGTSKLFFWNELIANTYLLGMNIIGFHFWGLSGLGISFSLVYMFYLIQVYLLSKIKFSFSFDKAFVKIFSIQFGLAVISFIMVNFLKSHYQYAIGVLIFSISLLYSLIELEKRLQLSSILRKYFSKYTFIE